MRFFWVEWEAKGLGELISCSSLVVSMAESQLSCRRAAVGAPVHGHAT